VIGFLSSRSPADTTHLLAGFRQGLADGGFIEHQNVAIEYRWALGQYDHLPALATELTRLPVVVVNRRSPRSECPSGTQFCNPDMTPTETGLRGWVRGLEVRRETGKE
jgi:hypothetical protein